MRQSLATALRQRGKPVARIQELRKTQRPYPVAAFFSYKHDCGYETVPFKMTATSLRTFSSFHPFRSPSSSSSSSSSSSATLGFSAIAAAGCLLWTTTTREGFLDRAMAEEHPRTEEDTGSNDEEEEGINVDDLNIYTAAEIARNDGKDGRPVWMSHGGLVYDVTDFIVNHPGGSEKIMLAAGSAIEPFWNLYRQHFATDLPMQLLEKMVIGKLKEEDQNRIDEMMEKQMDENDPYINEPLRHPALKVHSDQPMNAETPSMLLTENYLTPSELFYIRHHHPVPYLDEEKTKEYAIQIDLTAYGKGILSLTLDELKKLEKVEVIATLQCSGNRRSEYNATRGKTSGTTWGQGAVSTAKWGGARLRDVLALAGLENAIVAQEDHGINHVRFESLDGMKASINIEKAVSPYGDCILAYEMNGQPLPRDHGYPVRAIVPGYAAVRNVKWLSKVELSPEEAEGPWQRGLNYKQLPPCVKDAKSVKLADMPSMTEASLFSGITKMEALSSNGEDDGQKAQPQTGDRITMKASGWAWAGGGRNVVRVDVTGDGGKTWTAANLVQGQNQRFGRAWAWVFWTCEVPATVQDNGSIELSSKAVDLAFNVQPETCAHSWNVRGLGNNSWFRASTTISSRE